MAEDDLADAWTDEYGVKYSVNGKRLLKTYSTVGKYSIRKGTNVICDKAFSGCYNLTRIIVSKGSKRKFEQLLPEYIIDMLVEQ